MDAHLRAGVAVYNEGEYHGAHDAWEHLWLELASGTDDERLLHGLIQFTAAVFHARNGNWAGAVGLADSGRGYLAHLPDDYRRVNLDTPRSFLAALEADPERIERARPPALRVDGEALLYDDLPFDAATVAAGVIASEHGYDESLGERAASVAREKRADGEATRSFDTLVLEFLRGSTDR
jgi:predicted metal-dependent hydrolase